MSWSTLLSAGVAGLGTGTSIFSAVSQYQQGQFARNVSIRQAEALELQAKQTQQEAGQQIAISDYRSSHLLSRIITTAAASGVTEEGSPSINFATSADEARLNDMYTKYAANLQSASLQYQATTTKDIGEQEAKAADVGAITTGVGGTISSGIEAYGIKTKVDPFDLSYADPLQLGGP